MTQEEKSLLLKDLCARLPYITYVQARYKQGEPCYYTLRDIQWFINSNIEVIKPYLRPMSSMTDEERTEYLNACGNEMDNAFSSPRYSGIDYLNANHFDYRGLIEKGLALEAPKGMYNLNKE